MSTPQPNNSFDADDEKRVPEEPILSEVIPTRTGHLVSYRGLLERIMEQFYAEYDENFIKQVESDVQKRTMVRDVANYVFSVESVQLSLKEQADLIQKVYSDVMSYGVLDPLLADPTITTIAIEGVEKLAVRYAPGTELVPQERIFEDTRHLRRTLERLIHDAQAEFRDDIAILEVGLDIQGRRVCVNVATPPVVTILRADIRVHVPQLPTLDDLITQNILTPQSAQVLQALVASPHGFVIVGDTESGKTTLLSALAQLLPNPTSVISVERAGELRLPKGASQKVVQWAKGEHVGANFAQRVQQALDEKPTCLLLDEVRADEPTAITPLLSGDDVPRLIWSCRGASDPKRIRSALGIIARMSDPTQPEVMVQRLYERLPFIVTVKRRKGRILLLEIAEWQYPHEADYPDYVALLEMGWEALEITGKRPKHPLNLPDDFWNKSS
jgi:Flp pilus assembly CpaF family ATPase